MFGTPVDHKCEHVFDKSNFPELRPVFVTRYLILGQDSRPEIRSGFCHRALYVWKILLIRSVNICVTDRLQTLKDG